LSGGEQTVPQTKLWGDADAGYTIVLGCDCGTAVDYPGHPDERTEVRCDGCGKVWKVAE
jgi:hypothetical protein